MAPKSDLRVEGSFRDPTGFVFRLGDGVFRTVDGDFAKLWSALPPELRTDDLLVETELLAANSPDFRQARDAFPDVDHFLKHARIEVLNYPYEWSSSMLADAALLSLDLQKRLVDAGYSLKDATAYNVQFRGSRPVFLDVTSIETPPRRDIWMALDQFLRMFLFPLILHRHRHIDHKGYFLSNIEGLSVGRVREILGKFASLRPSFLLDVGLPDMLTGIGDSKKEKMRKDVHRGGGDPKALLLNLQRLRSKIRKLTRRKRLGPWTEYTRTHSYTGAAEEEKVRFVGEFLQKSKPSTVLDLGCNTGKYSRLAVDAGSRVTAIDSDEGCIDILYRYAKEGNLDILPIWTDIANPSPGIGFRNRERTPLLERIRSDAVLALALVHHLLVTSRLPLESIRDLLADLTDRWLLVEFIEPGDTMFQKLIGMREDIYAHLSLDSFLKAFQDRFSLVRRVKLPDVQRHLVLMEKR